MLNASPDVGRFYHLLFSVWFLTVPCTVQFPQRLVYDREYDIPAQYCGPGVSEAVIEMSSIV